jgi:Protein of unknown function (DUF2934)
VPRKPKRPVDSEPPESADSQSANGKSNGSEPKKKLRAAVPPTKKKKAAAPKKSPAKKPATPTAKAPVEPTDDEIRLRAYFLAERRHKLSLPGDSAHDWIEARRQLIEEAKR